jgi:hypothetical protein
MSKLIHAFGPHGATQYADYAQWASAAKRRGFVLVQASSGPVAQDSPYGTCHGAWFYRKGTGWLAIERQAGKASAGRTAAPAKGAATPIAAPTGQPAPGHAKGKAGQAPASPAPATPARKAKARKRPPTLLGQYMAAGIIWREGREYLGRAADGVVVTLGMCDDVDDAYALECYLQEHPTPDTW